MSPKSQNCWLILQASLCEIRCVQFFLQNPLHDLDQFSSQGAIYGDYMARKCFKCQVLKYKEKRKRFCLFCPKSFCHIYRHSNVAQHQHDKTQDLFMSIPYMLDMHMQLDIEGIETAVDAFKVQHHPSTLSLLWRGLLVRTEKNKGKKIVWSRTSRLKHDSQEVKLAMLKCFQFV